jgi:hypothetical protein
VLENTIGEVIPWLPIGRSLFRDKRVPRENLNGLSISKSGISAVLYKLTGIGGPWAQDPPYYARVDKFETNVDYDLSSTSVENWHGWDHKRTITLNSEGPLVILDSVSGPPGQSGALIWHLLADGEPSDGRVRLREGDSPAEVILISINGGKPTFERLHGSVEGPNLRVKYQTLEDQNLQTVTIFLTGDWVGAEANLLLDLHEPQLIISKANLEIQMPIGNYFNLE